MEPKMVLPGDEIAVAEEFEPGEGTYERNGLVFAATPGVLILDPANRVARVRAFNPPAELKVGDIVYGVVDDIRGMMATATILAIHGRTRQISGESEGPLFGLPRPSRAPGSGALLSAGRTHGTTETRGGLRGLAALCARDRTRRWEGRGETSGASGRGS